jgi:hypothetical protein
MDSFARKRALNGYLGTSENVNEFEGEPMKSLIYIEERT